MSGKPSMPSGDPAEQAIYWLTWLSSGEASEDDRRSFDRWLKEDSAHQTAWDNAQRLWQDVSRLTEADLGADIAPIPAKDALSKKRVFYSGLGMAVCFLLSVVLWTGGISYYLADYRSATGEQRQLTLADGSSVQLNSDTAISVDYSAELRRLILHRGEAWFKVTADPDRPFEVETDYGTVRALGTAFDVDDSNGQITVTVYEHAVRVRLNDGEQVERLLEGSALSFGQDIIKFEQRADLSKASAWRQQRMVFQNRPLQDVIRELNRYRNGRIIIADQSLNALPLTGVFDTDSPEEALQMIRQSLKLSEYRITDRLVFLYR